jgi:hypothetical protein
LNQQVVIAVTFTGPGPGAALEWFIHIIPTLHIAHCTLCTRTFENFINVSTVFSYQVPGIKFQRQQRKAMLSYSYGV